MLFARRGHSIVAQIIETELAVRPVSNIHRVLLAADVRRLIVLDAADRQAEKRVELAHPLSIAPRQIIVNGDQMRAASGEGI